MNGRTAGLTAVALVAVAALAVLGTWRLALATGPDVNNDGIVLSADISEVVMAYGQEVPIPPTLTFTPTATATAIATNTPTDTPTNTPTPTPTPTFTPQPQTGGGHEQILAQNLVLPFGTTTRVATVDSSLCPGALVYFVARSTDPVRATIIKVYINGNFEQQIQVDPSWRSFFFQRAVNTIDINVNTDLGYDVKVSVDMHCQPSHE